MDSAILLEAVPIIQPAINLSAEQEEAKALILKFVESPGDKREWRQGGFAGTGKTTEIKELLKTLGFTCGVAAFTGKAVSVLRRKGVAQAQTLHSMMYNVKTNPVTKKTTFERKPALFYRCIIVDEASMVSTQLYNDLMSFGIPVIFFGDPAQLEPVGDNPNLMRQCDHTFTHIHRQAEGNPILALATEIREGRDRLPKGEWIGKSDDGTEKGRLKIQDNSKGLDITSFDMILCSKNATRHSLNASRRAHDGYLSDGPEVGESIICLANDSNQGMFNGLTTTIKRIEQRKENRAAFDLVDDLGLEYHGIEATTEFFGKNYVRPPGRNASLPFDWANALTVWKSQGSEWGNVLGVEERVYKVDHARLLYTMLTRASRNMTVIRASKG